MASHLPPPLNAGGGASATAPTTAIIIALTFVASAQAVDRRGTDAEAARDLGYAEQIFLDPSWTQRFVFGRCALGDSWIGLW
jgi:hypothetical protein